MNKNIRDINYSWNNLPEHILFVQDNQNTIDYLYDAADTKLRKVTSSDRAAGLTTDYSGPFVYEDSKLAFIQTSEGWIVPDHDEYAYEYFLKDHLGNTRDVFNEQGEVLQSNSYYPFGGIMEGLKHTAGLVPENKYLYNGKEMQDDFGLDWHDYGARFYDAQLGRWHVVDPLAEEYYPYSPYTYVGANPLIRVDENGEYWNYVIGAVGGAVVEAGAQVAISMANGSSFKDACMQIDIADVGIAALEGAATSGSSITKNLTQKGIVIATNEALMATVDYSYNGGLATTGGFAGDNKPISESATEFAVGMTGAKVSNSIVRESAEMTSNTLRSGTYSTLSSSEKASARSVDNFVNSNVYSNGVNTAANLSEKVTNNLAEDLLSMPALENPTPPNSVIVNDNTNMVKPRYLYELPN